MKRRYGNGPKVVGSPGSYEPHAMTIATPYFHEGKRICLRREGSKMVVVTEDMKRLPDAPTFPGLPEARVWVDANFSVAK